MPQRTFFPNDPTFHYISKKQLSSNLIPNTDPVRPHRPTGADVAEVGTCPPKGQSLGMTDSFSRVRRPQRLTAQHGLPLNTEWPTLFHGSVVPNDWPIET